MAFCRHLAKGAFSSASKRATRSPRATRHDATAMSAVVFPAPPLNDTNGISFIVMLLRRCSGGWAWQAGGQCPVVVSQPASHPWQAVIRAYCYYGIAARWQDVCMALWQKLFAAVWQNG